MLIEIKIDLMISIGACCQMCKNIFIQGDQPYDFLRLIVEKDGEKDVVIYLEEKYEPEEFLKKHREKILHNLCDFDHLTEKEQRERGILKEYEQWSPKKGNIGEFALKSDMLKEIKKCQLVCCFCHIVATMNRETKSYKNTGIREIKNNYVMEIKKKGCSKCLYKNENMLRFFEFDHIDPENKKESITNMISPQKYSLDDIKKEIEKTVLLCRFCHRMRSKVQRDRGEIHPSFRMNREKFALEELQEKTIKEPTKIVLKIKPILVN